MEYDVVNEGKCLLLKQRNPEWVIKSAYFSIAFTTEPDEVLDMGSNGLHYLEHILFNVIHDKGDYFTGNASTFDDGTMTFFFICENTTFDANVTAFFDGFESALDPKNYKKFKPLYKREQRRVTTEVAKMPDIGEVPLMFARNPELYKGKYSGDFIWNILLHKCKLEKVLVMAHCNVSKEVEKTFVRRAKQFNEKWSNRGKIELPDPPIPYTTVFPPSYIQPAVQSIEKALKEPVKTTISLRHIDNPIVRLIIMSTIESVNGTWNSTPYLFRIHLKTNQKKLPLKIFDVTPRSGEMQYYWANMFLSSGENLTSEMVNDIVKSDIRKLFAKHKKYAQKELESIMQQYNSFAHVG